MVVFQKRQHWDLLPQSMKDIWNIEYKRKIIVNTLILVDILLMLLVSLH
jgi:hypothetical protein